MYGGEHALIAIDVMGRLEIADSKLPSQIAVLFSAARSAVKEDRMADIELFTVPGSHIGFGASLHTCTSCAVMNKMP